MKVFSWLVLGAIFAFSVQASESVCVERLSQALAALGDGPELAAERRALSRRIDHWREKEKKRLAAEARLSDIDFETPFSDSMRDMSSGGIRHFLHDWSLEWQGGDSGSRNGTKQTIQTLANTLGHTEEHTEVRVSDEFPDHLRLELVRLFQGQLELYRVLALHFGLDGNGRRNGQEIAAILGDGCTARQARALLRKAGRCLDGQSGLRLMHLMAQEMGIELVDEGEGWAFAEKAPEK